MIDVGLGEGGLAASWAPGANEGGFHEIRHIEGPSEILDLFQTRLCHGQKQESASHRGVRRTKIRMLALSRREREFFREGRNAIEEEDAPTEETGAGPLGGTKAGDAVRVLASTTNEDGSSTNERGDCGMATIGSVKRVAEGA